MSRKNSFFYTVATLMGLAGSMAFLSLPASANDNLYAQTGGASGSSGTDMQGYPGYGRGAQSGQNMNNNGTQGYPNYNNTGTQNGQYLNNTNQGYPNNTGTQNDQYNNTNQGYPDNTGTQNGQYLNNGTNGSGVNNNTGSGSSGQGVPALW